MPSAEWSSNGPCIGPFKQLAHREIQPLCKPSSFRRSESWNTDNCNQDEGCNRDEGYRCMAAACDRLLGEIKLSLRKHHDQLYQRIDTLIGHQGRILSHLENLRSSRNSFGSHVSFDEEQRDYHCFQSESYESEHAMEAVTAHASLRSLRAHKVASDAHLKVASDAVLRVASDAVLRVASDAHLRAANMSENDIESIPRESLETTMSVPFMQRIPSAPVVQEAPSMQTSARQSMKWNLNSSLSFKACDQLEKDGGASAKMSTCVSASSNQELAPRASGESREGAVRRALSWDDTVEVDMEEEEDEEEQGEEAEDDNNRMQSMLAGISFNLEAAPLGKNFGPALTADLMPSSTTPVCASDNSRLSKSGIARETASITSWNFRDEQPRTTFCFVISSIDPRRITWDFLWCIAFAFDIWLTSIQVAFAVDGYMPSYLKTLSLITVLFFCLDIVLNFFTGFMRGRHECLDPCQTTVHYFKSWFLPDCLATIPWELFFGADASAVSMMRIAKAPKMAKFSKVRKLIRLLRISQRLQFAKKAGGRLFTAQTSLSARILNFCRRSQIALVLKIAVVVACLCHLNGTLYALLQVERPKQRENNEIFDWYVECLWLAYCQLSFRTSELQVLSIPALWVLEIILLLERLLIVVHVLLHVVFIVMVEREDDSRLSVKHEYAMKYLRQRQLSNSTQAQLLDSFNETTKQRKMHHWFTDLMNNDVPAEMEKRIYEELWSDSLQTLDLIRVMSKHHPDFVFLLAQKVQEQVYASRAIVVKEGESSTCAYYIIDGEVVVMNSAENSFTNGMWVGEKALVNPRLRRSGFIGTMTVTCFLVVPSDAYFGLITDFDLQDQFVTFCTEELWKGLCGRCGSMGSHWTHECPYAKQSQGFFRKKLSTGNTDYMHVISADLKAFINHYRFDSSFVSLLEELGVCSLQDLEDKQALIRLRLPHDDKIEMQSSQSKALSRQAIRKFRNDMVNKIKTMLISDNNANQHFMFLSHYKVEAGTEAALMRAELKQLFEEDESHPAQAFDAPIYLDSENLEDLRQLMEAVARSHNLVLICTKNVLKRPWCLIEIATAVRKKIPILPVNIMKEGCEFEFPSESFYKDLKNGTLLGRDGNELVTQQGFSIDDVCCAVQQIFMRIACPYSPHRPAEIRKAELSALLKQCRLLESKPNFQRRRQSLFRSGSR